MKILLVDDDVGIIQVLLPALKSMNGTQARAAITGAEAMESAGHWGGVDLLITDVFMSPMNGFTLRNKLRQSYPAMRTLFLSGYDMSSYAEHVEDSQVLFKPFDRNQLIRAITAMNIQSIETPKPAPVDIPPAPVKKAEPLHSIARLSELKAQLLKQKEVTSSVFLGVPEFPHEIKGPLAGRTIGTYRVVRELGYSQWGTLYQAIQIPMQRTVIMEVLSSDRASFPGVKKQFLANAGAKANQRHPFLLEVYEGGDISGLCFYTYEDIEGENLASMINSGKNIDDQAAEAILDGVIATQIYFQTNHIPCGKLEASNIYLGVDQKPRMVNPAIQNGNPPDEREQIRALAEILGLVLPGGRASGKSLRIMLVCMLGEGDLALTSWEALLEFSQALRPKTTPKRGQAEAARKARVTMVKRLVLVGLILLGLVGSVFYYKGVKVDQIMVLHKSEVDFDAMLKVPAGEFIYQSKRKVMLPDFWIDKYEVTLGQYAKFLDYLQQHPDEAAKFDHPQQPRGKSHLPHDWETIYAAAKAKQPYKNFSLALSCPVFNVDWWDASAYARWKGRRLPTEQEWEKAARGTNGQEYPWGNEWDPKKCNSNAEHLNRSGTENSQGKGDGFFGCCPVNAIPADVSPYGVIGMAGNVSEWTSSHDPLDKCPIIRGGNFATDDNKVTHRIALLAPDGVSEYVGFRTATDKPPIP